jgi:glucosylceramidase
MDTIVVSKNLLSARVYLTAKDTECRLSEVARLSLQPRRSGQNETNSAHLFVDTTRRFRPLIGIGGALTDASAEVVAQLPAHKQREYFTMQFDPIKGVGYSLGRVNINSCDFSSDMYTYCAEGDASLASFSIAHDLVHKIPMVRRAFDAAGTKFPVFASPWSPPAWMKTNNNMLYGGKLLPQYRDAWARYYVKFVEHYAREGIPLWGLTVQNEPEAVQHWESCIYTPEEERDFIRDHLGPTLEKSGLGSLKLIAWDHNRDFMYERARVILSDPEAARYVWGIGYHWYVQECYDNVALVRESFPDTHLIFTEGCHYITDPDKWLCGEKYGLSVIQDLNRGCEAWCDWNVLLDKGGGPNHVGNFCMAPVHADLEKGELIYTPSYYYLGHFSKFIRPGYTRVACSSTSDSVLATAYVSPERRKKDDKDEVVVVAMNKSDREHITKIAIGDREMTMSLPPHSIATAIIQAG